MLFIAMVLFLIWNKKKINFTEQFQKTCILCCYLGYSLKDKAKTFPFYVMKVLN